ncbi:unnamed protein product [Amaranthus hypochondriacus]
MKWNPDKSNSHKHDAKHQDNSTTHYKAYKYNGLKEEEDWNGVTAKIEEKSRRKRSVDDSFFVRSTSLLGQSTSRRSHTPTPTMRRNSSRSSGMLGSLKRSVSRKATTSPSPIQTPNRQSTTPIIFSNSTARKKPKHVEKVLECSLEELCFGAVKKITITKDVISDLGIIVQEEETLQIKVKPGWRNGTKITFEGKGDEKPGYLPADIVFSIEEKKHPLYKRVGDDLELEIEIPLLKALVGCTITLPLLSGDKMVFRIDDHVIYPGYEKIIYHQGMIKANDKHHRGDLRLKFNVRFPEVLGDNQRLEICSILQSCF